jgi:DNA polymerase-3 subunit gamma/tau
VAPDVVGVSGSERDVLTSQAERVGLATLVRAMEVLGQAQISMREAPDPRVALEVALVRLAHPDADDSPAALLARIERLESSGSPPAPAAPGPATTPAPASAPTPAPADSSRHVPVPEPVRPAAESGDTGSAPPAAASRKTLGAVRRESAPPPAAASPSPPAPASTPAANPAPAASAPVAAAAAPGALPTRDELVQAWGDHVIGRLRPKAKALFQAGRFVGVEKDKAVFGLPNEIHRGRCEEVRGEVESALAEHFGRPVGLVLVVDAAAGAGDVPPPDRAATPPDPPDPEQPAATGPGSQVEASATPEPAPAPVVRAPDPGPEDLEDLSAFDEAELGEVASFDNSPESRVLKAFPGAEEVG